MNVISRYIVLFLGCWAGLAAAEVRLILPAQYASDAYADWVAQFVDYFAREIERPVTPAFQSAGLIDQALSQRAEQPLIVMGRSTLLPDAANAGWESKFVRRSPVLSAVFVLRSEPVERLAYTAGLDALAEPGLARQFLAVSTPQCLQWVVEGYADGCAAPLADVRIFESLRNVGFRPVAPPQEVYFPVIFVAPNLVHRFDQPFSTGDEFWLPMTDAYRSAIGG